MKCIILLASPGAGKGTASDYIDNGKFVSDELVMDVLKRNIDSNNIILDGIPRNLNQAKILDQFLKENNIDLDKVIFIDIDKEIAAKRVINRLTCDKCKRVYNKELIDSKECMICGGNLITREDDTKEVFENRYDTYLKETKPLVDYYKDKLVRIYNNDTLESLYNNLDKEMR